MTFKVSKLFHLLLVNAIKIGKNDNKIINSLNFRYFTRP